MMRNLFLRNVSIWPRFQIVVAQSLEGKKKAEVIELEVPMSDSMRDIQNAIMECVEVSIGELKKANTGLDMEDWNLDSALHKQFDMIVRRQLDPVWHRVSWKTKQIVNDLTVLRGMLHTLLRMMPYHLIDIWIPYLLHILPLRDQPGKMNLLGCSLMLLTLSSIQQSAESIQEKLQMLEQRTLNLFTQCLRNNLSGLC